MTITNKYIKLGDLEIAEELFELIQNDIAPETGIDDKKFWLSLETIIKRLQERNSELLSKRDKLQKQIDEWHLTHRDKKHEPVAYKQFLQKIGYLLEEPDDFHITTKNIDAEIAEIAGPQLVVPLDNTRYILNAVNARWGSLYDAFYSTDVISEANGCKKTQKYNPIRGERVILRTRHFMDRHFSLERDTHKHVTKYFVKNDQFIMQFGDGSKTTLLKPQQFIGYTGKPENPDSVLLCHHSLHLEIKFGDGYFIGHRDHANIYDIQIEAAITTIMDCEDSVVSVDTKDKIKVYKNLIGLMKGTLTSVFEKENETIVRAMDPDKEYISANGEPAIKHGRSLMLIRNVGHHLYTDMVLCNGQLVPETMIDLMVTALCAIHDLNGNTVRKNSRSGSVYIIKPKMHGPEEVAFSNQLFSHVEDALKLPANTLKMGIMDEERRTSVNLKACIHAAKERVIFINTGFLDRTGDDIHTNMEAGPVIPKSKMKQAKWLQAYENSNVRVGLNCGFKGKAQIGKGMWTMPEEMNDMIKTKIQHLKAGASTSWVPSPIAAILHAIHYHKLNVYSRQSVLMKKKINLIDDILNIDIMTSDQKLTTKEIQYEIENNVQGILGYVSRWVGQGIGCSKVPDVNDIALMEDCATLRISSQHIANWLHHNIVSEDEVRDAIKRMAVIIDRQNRDDKEYEVMSENFDKSIPFQAALDLIFKGIDQANGYTEFILYKRRREQKSIVSNS